MRMNKNPFQSMALTISLLAVFTCQPPGADLHPPAVTYVLNIIRTPEAGGWIMPSPDQAAYTAGSVVTLTVTPAAQYIFDHWSGDAAGAETTKTITMNSDKNITAYFQKVLFALDIAVRPSDGGGCTKTPDQIYYPAGTTVDISASPQPGYDFDYWSGDVVSTSPTVSTVIQGDMRLTANFKDPAVVGDIRGIVVESAGGAPVDAAEVRIVDSPFITVTDSQGFFTFTGISPGAYDLLAAKTGRAGSRLQGVEVTSGQIANVEIIEPRYCLSSVSVTPPTIAVQGIVKGGTYGADAPISVVARPGSNPVTATYDHAAIMVRYGSTTGYWWDAKSMIESLNTVLKVNDYPVGPLTVNIVAYDNNNNRSELTVPIFISHSGGGSVPSRVPECTIAAYTVDESMNIYRSAPPHSTIFVDISVDPVQDATGIQVYRSASSSGPFVLIGKSTILLYTAEMNVVYVHHRFMDVSAELSPEQTYYYRVSYMNQYGEGSLTEPLPVRILPTYSLNLVSPANNSVITTRLPTFRWTADTIAGATRSDMVTVRDKITGTFNLIDSYGGNDLTEIRWNRLLSYSTLYEWNVRSEYQLYVRVGSHSIISHSYPTISAYAKNGAFYFTIEQGRE